MRHINFKPCILLFAFACCMLYSIDIITADEVCNNIILTESNKSNTTNIFFWYQNKWVKLTNFNTPNIVFDWSLSFDKRYAYVWYHEEYPPRKMDIYEIPSGKLLSHFYPGYGGSISWTYYNTILIEHGCGAVCNGVLMYNTSGDLLFQTASISEVVSPNLKMVITFIPKSYFTEKNFFNKKNITINEFNQPGLSRSPLIAVIRDLSQGQVIFVYRNIIVDSLNINAIWESDNEITIYYGSESKIKTASIKIKQDNK